MFDLHDSGGHRFSRMSITPICGPENGVYAAGAEGYGIRLTLQVISVEEADRAIEWASGRIADMVKSRAIGNLPTPSFAGAQAPAAEPASVEPPPAAPTPPKRRVGRPPGSKNRVIEPPAPKTLPDTATTEAVVQPEPAQPEAVEPEAVEPEAAAPQPPVTEPESVPPYLDPEKAVDWRVHYGKYVGKPLQSLSLRVIHFYAFNLPGTTGPIDGLETSILRDENYRMLILASRTLWEVTGLPVENPESGGQNLDVVFSDFVGQ